MQPLIHGITGSIDGVIIEERRVIPTEGGPVLHMLRADSPLFTGFGEMYFSEVEPGAVKAWKRHKRQTQLFAVPVGCMEIIIYDDRADSATVGTVARYELGRPDAYGLLCIPPLLWYGFAALGNSPALLANCADIPHDPTESERLPATSAAIPFCWGKR